MDTIGVPTDPSNHIINGMGPLTKMLEMGTEPIDVIGGRANLFVTKRAMGKFFSSEPPYANHQTRQQIHDP